jgi:hypothetical protein
MTGSPGKVHGPIRTPAEQANDSILEAWPWRRNTDGFCDGPRALHVPNIAKVAEGCADVTPGRPSSRPELFRRRASAAFTARGLSK